MANYHDQLILHSKLFIALLENTKTNEKSSNIIDCIKKGADVNARFADHNNNTPLHIAVEKGDKEVVNILLRYGARANIANKEGKTALTFAKELPERSDIAEILADNEEATTKEAASLTIGDNDNVLGTAAVCRYKKRPGTANVRGQLYETKLLTLIYLRASRCKHFTQFYVGTNVDGIGDMDDVCLRFKTVNDDYVVFLQAKHKENVVKGRIGIRDLYSASGDFSLLKYFTSYRQIRDKFNPNSDDELFRGRYENLKCSYVMYTTVKDEIDCTRKKLDINNEVTDLIGTGEYRNIFQLKYNEQYIIEVLTNTIMIERIRNMGRKLFKLIQTNKYDMMLGDENIRSFHVVLAQKVIKVSEINTEGLRTGIFRQEFFSSNEELLIVLRETLYKEAAKNNHLRTDEIKISISKILFKPEADTISELIGNILTYDSNTNTLNLNFDKQDIDQVDEMSLSRLQVPQSVVNKAFEIFGRRKLTSLTFNLPAAFGNLDFTVNKKKAARRLDYLAKKITDVINESVDAKGNVVIRKGMYATNKWLKTGDLAINGGITSAVGNVLVSDNKNKLKFNLDVDLLGENAKILLQKIKERLINIEKYRFVTESDDFPRLSMHATQFERRFVKDFLDNLYFYTSQAKEDQLEEIVTKELQAHECSDSFSKAESRIRSNALFLKVHNEIQIWWMTEETAPYLTRSTFEYIFRNLLNKGLLTFLNFVYLKKMYNVGLEFNSDAMEVLSICGCVASHVIIVIHTNVPLLTCLKLVQYYRGVEDYTFLDIDYLCQMSPNCLSTITDELGKMNIRNVIITSEDVSKYNEVIHACDTRKIILVTSNFVPRKEYISVRDERINLTDLTEASQRKVLQNKFTFQGKEMTFAEVFDEDTKYLISSRVLEKIINRDHNIIIGQTLMQSMYEETKYYYVPRTLLQTKSSDDSSDRPTSATEDEFSPFTLIDHRDIFKWTRKNKAYDVILVLDAPGMGKSTLLTHLALETKRRYPKIWIQRINLIDHTKQFHDWHEQKIEVDSLEALKFICKIALSKESFGGNFGVPYNSNINLQIINDEIELINPEEVNPVVAFELNIFLNCFKEGRIVFLFDGFDEVCPHYKREVMHLLKYLARCGTMSDVQAEACKPKLYEQCIWITSRPYNDLRKTLEIEFGEAYTLQPFSYRNIHVFVEKYLKKNIDLNALKSNQLKNINGFLNYMIEYSSDFTVINNLLKSVYVSAISYFENEIKRLHVTDDNLMFVTDWNRKLKDLISCIRYYEPVKGEVPLHVYFAIHFFQNQLKDVTLTDTKDLLLQWDLDTNAFAFYERFIETKLKTIRFEEKNRMDIYNPDVKITYEKEKKEFLDKHKKLAFYIVCDKEVFTSAELEDIKDIIKGMEIGKDKTGFVDKVVDGKPRFIHYTFAEYFAVEYIFDSLKSRETHKINRMLDYILSCKIYITTFNILHHINLKIKSDKTFITTMCTPHVNDYILKTLGKQILGSHDENTPFFTVTYMERLRYLATFVINALIGAVDESNFSIFMVVMESAFFNIFKLMYDHSEIVCNILDCIRRFNTSKIDDLLPYRTNERKLSEKNNEEILKELRTYHRNRRMTTDLQNANFTDKEFKDLVAALCLKHKNY